MCVRACVRSFVVHPNAIRRSRYESHFSSCNFRFVFCLNSPVFSLIQDGGLYIFVLVCFSNFYGLKTILMGPVILKMLEMSTSVRFFFLVSGSRSKSVIVFYFCFVMFYI